MAGQEAAPWQYHPRPRITGQLDLHRPPGKGTAKGHSSKRCQNNALRWSGMGSGISQGRGLQGGVGLAVVGLCGLGAWRSGSIALTGHSFFFGSDLGKAGKCPLTRR